MAPTSLIIQPFHPEAKELPITEKLFIIPNGSYNQLIHYSVIKCHKCNSFWSGENCGTCKEKLRFSSPQCEKYNALSDGGKL